MDVFIKINVDKRKLMENYKCSVEGSIESAMGWVSSDGITFKEILTEDSLLYNFIKLKIKDKLIEVAGVHNMRDEYVKEIADTIIHNEFLKSVFDEVVSQTIFEVLELKLESFKDDLIDINNDSEAGVENDDMYYATNTAITNIKYILDKFEK